MHPKVMAIIYNYSTKASRKISGKATLADNTKTCEPSGEKMSLWPIFQNFRASGIYLDFEEEFSIFA